MNRREILQAGAAIAAASFMPRMAFAEAGAGSGLFAPQPASWRSFEITTKLNPPASTSAIKAWVPLPGFQADQWNRPEGNRWTTNAPIAHLERDAQSGANMLYVEWDAGQTEPELELVSQISTRDRAIDLSQRISATPLTNAERALYLSGSRLAPIEGKVKALSDKITVNAQSDLDKARAIYEWMVENTYRLASTRGCGEGNILAMLESGDFGGKCADLNPLYVALVRAAGVPARDLYGIRVAPSAFGYKSLGAKNETITKAQHCRAEVYLDQFGWIATDPADVRKLMLEEEKDGLGADDPRVMAARKALFGSWEGNWIAYNDAKDIDLPSSEQELGFLMYPQAEIANIRLDCLEPDSFRYELTAREITA